MICPNCQKETPAGNCCMHCGAVLNQNSQSIPSVTTNNANQPKKKKGGAIVAIIIAVVAVIGIIASFLPQGPTGTAVFQLTEADGSHSDMTYYYENDVVYKMVESYTMIFAEGLPETNADMIQAQLDLEYAGVKGLSFCNIAYTHDENSFTVTVTYTDLDQVPTITALESAKLIETEGEDGQLISYTKSKEGLLADGYKLVSEG